MGIKHKIFSGINSIYFQVMSFKYLIVLLLLPLLIIINLNNVYGQQKQVKVALAQICCLDGDRAGNFVRIENAIIEAKEKGAEIVCFAEASILGWINPDAYKRAYPIPGEDSNRLCELAKKHNVFLSIGLVEKDNDKLYDSAVLIDNSGNILLKHRKIIIVPGLMTRPYTPGKSVKTIDTKFGKIGILICADSYLDQVLIRMKKLKPDFVIIPYGWVQAEKNWPEHAERLKDTIIKSAKVIGAPIIGTNPVGEITHGPWTGMLYGGSSMASDKNGNIIATGKDRDRDILVTAITY